MQLGLNDLHDALGGNGLDGVLETRKGVDVVRRQQVGSRAQQLAELDEARPELLQGAGELGAMVVLVRVVVVGVQAVWQGKLVQISVVVMAHAELGRNVVELVLAQHAEDLEVAFGML